MSNHGRRAVAGAAVAAGLVLLAGCGDSSPLDTWNPKGVDAQKIHDLQWWVFAIAGIVGIVVFAVVAVAVVKFRDRGDDRIPKQVHGAPKLEVAWTIAPAVLLAGIAVPTLAAVFDLTKQDDPGFEITVIGQQWWWEYQYRGSYNGQSLDGIVTSGEMVIPAGVRVPLRTTSRDVIHSWWVPALNGKRDAVPNRFHDWNIQAFEPGDYLGWCTEFCGLSHANMRAHAVALTPENFVAWAKNQQKPAAKPTDPTALQGMGVFAAQCARCHTVKGLTQTVKDPTTGAETEQPVIAAPDQQLVSGAAPSLTHLMSRTSFAGAKYDLKKPGCTNDSAYDQAYVTGTAGNCLNRADLESWLRNAPEMKPMYAQLNDDKKYRGMPALGLSEQQIDLLVAYLVTLK
ncbi:MAG: cytochrome c oxidase subunit II [Acidimicrobiales bacterium]